MPPFDRPPSSRQIPSLTFRARRIVGRLVEVWAVHISSPADVKALAGQFMAACAPKPEKNVVCADYRGLHVLPPDALDAWSDAFRVFNATLERSALILSDSPQLMEQFKKITAGAPLDSRRLFTEVTTASVFLSGVLDADERAQLHAFLRPLR